ncbi:MAG: GtrA family protein [Acidiferrobacteraceae bacterium]
MLPRGIRREAFRFGAIGGIGFVIDGGILTALHSVWGVGLIPARLVSFSVAVTATWALNRRYTFAARQDPRVFSEWRRYAAVNGVGGLLNLGIFFALIARFPRLAATPLLPLALAASVALLFNFVASRQIAFRGRHHGA